MPEQSAKKMKMVEIPDEVPYLHGMHITASNILSLPQEQREACYNHMCTMFFRAVADRGDTFEIIIEDLKGIMAYYWASVLCSNIVDRYPTVETEVRLYHPKETTSAST